MTMTASTGEADRATDSAPSGRRARDRADLAELGERLQLAAIALVVESPVTGDVDSPIAGVGNCPPAYGSELVDLDDNLRLATGARKACACRATQAGVVEIYRSDAGASTNLDSFTGAVLVSGNHWAFSAIGNVLTAYTNTGSRRAALTPTVSDSSYPAGGSLAILCSDTTMALSAFGGDTVGQLLLPMSVSGQLRT
jgi:hypothetical protein